MGKTLTQCIQGGNRDGKKGYLIAFAYDLDLVESLKRTIPHTDREWRPDSKTWWVSDEYEDALKSFFGNFEALARWQGKLL